MPSFEETLARMKNLYTYGKELNESKATENYTLEHHAIAADGKAYGIVRECSKYYIKTAPKAKENIAEAYDYIGGFNNKGDYQYSSYPNALHHFELKMASINEACDSKVNNDVDSFRGSVLMTEATESMKAEIARQRQIMYNASMIMNESTEIGADRKDDVVKYDGPQPEAEEGKKGDEDYKKAQEDKSGEKVPAGTKGVDKKAAPFEEAPAKAKDQLSECDGSTCDWGSEGIGKGRDPKSIGWDMEGQKVVNEEESDWGSKGLPSEAGIGEADTEHNDDPFVKSVNEGECCPKCGKNPCECTISEEIGDGEEIDGEEGAEEDDIDLGVDSDDEDFNIDDELGAEDDFDGEDFSAEDDLDAEGEPAEDDLDAKDDLDAEDEPAEEDDLMKKIEELQAEIDALKAQIGDEEPIEDEPIDDEPADDADLDAEDDLGAEEELGDDDFGAEDFESDDAEGDLGAEEEPAKEDEFGEIDEAKRAQMNSIVENVVSRILSEDVLHDFGKHPGYRKKPMELPTTGEDKNAHGEDWNDESVHSEEPFGKQIGDGDPFNKLVDAITKDVMSQLKSASEDDDKKKAE